MTTDLRAHLDRLDTALTAGTVHLPLRQDSGYGEDVISADGVQFGVSGEPADAALIVAAVNALPRLLAAVRAAADLADELQADSERAYQRSVKGHRIDEFSDGQHHAYDLDADRLRTALSAALTERDQT